METIELYGKTFDIEKLGRGKWQTSYRGSYATIGTTRASVISELKTYDKDKVLAGCAFRDANLKRDTYFQEHEQEFKSIFGFAPPRDFIMYQFGCGLCLDVITLDKHLHTPDDISTNDYIQKVYGDRAAELVKNMI